MQEISVNLAENGLVIQKNGCTPVQINNKRTAEYLFLDSVNFAGDRDWGNKL